MDSGIKLEGLTLASAARLLANKEISAVELTTAVLERIERLNELARAFIAVTSDLAIEKAKVADREIAGGHRPPLQGIPVSLKDNYDTADTKTTVGSKIYANRIPARNAPLVDKLNSAGAILIGKANLHEFAFG